VFTARVLCLRQGHCVYGEGTVFTVRVLCLQRGYCVCSEGTIFLFLLLTLSVFLKDTQKMNKNIVSDAVRSHGKVFCTVSNEEVYEAVDMWLMDS
jgi:hypothetical protein